MPSTETSPSGPDRLRVVEVSEGLSGAFAGLILASLGHDVAQVRSGLRRRLDGAESAFYDRGRTTVDEPGALEQLIGHADVILVDAHPARIRQLGLPAGEEELEGVRPGLIGVVVTSFGLGGPHSGYARSDITDWAAGGLSYVTRRAVARSDTEHYSPVLPPGRQPEVLGGLAAAIGTLSGRALQRRTGRSVLVDVSRQEVLVAMSHSYLPWFVHNLVLLGTPQNRVDWGWLVPAADGDVYIRTVETSQWDRLVEWMGHPDWARREEGELPLYHLAPELVGPLLGEWTVRHPRQWLLDEGVRWRVPIALPRSATEVLEWDQLRQRDAWTTVDTAAGPARAPRLPLLPSPPPGRPATCRELLGRWARA